MIVEKVDQPPVTGHASPKFGGHVGHGWAGVGPGRARARRRFDGWLL